MIQEFKEDYKALAELDMVPGGRLEGIVKAQTGDSFPGRDMPALTIDSFNRMQSVDNGNHWEVAVEFVTVLYVASLTSDYEATEAIANNLLMRPDGNGFKGLHTFLAHLAQHGWTQSNGRVWDVTLNPDSTSGAVRSAHAQFASVAHAFRFTLSAWVDKDQY